MDVHAEGAVVAGVDRHALQGFGRAGLEVHGTEEATEDPEVGVAFGFVDDWFADSLLTSTSSCWRAPKRRSAVTS